MNTKQTRDPSPNVHQDDDMVWAEIHVHDDYICSGPFDSLADLTRFGALQDDQYILVKMTRADFKRRCELGKCFDPNRALINIRAIIRDIRNRPACDAFDMADELAEFIGDLDRWLTMGGKIPHFWNLSIGWTPHEWGETTRHSVE